MVTSHAVPVPITMVSSPVPAMRTSVAASELGRMVETRCGQMLSPGANASTRTVAIGSAINANSAATSAVHPNAASRVDPTMRAGTQRARAPPPAARARRRPGTVAVIARDLRRFRCVQPDTRRVPAAVAALGRRRRAQLLAPESNLTLSTSSEAFLRSSAIRASGIGSALSAPSSLRALSSVPATTGYSLLTSA